MSELFEEKALAKKKNKVSSVKSISLLSTPLKGAIGTGIALSAGALLWSCFARIPMKATGYGVIVPNGTFDTKVTASTGRIHFTFENGKHRQPEFASTLSYMIQNPDAISKNTVSKFNDEIQSYYTTLFTSEGAKNQDVSPPRNKLPAGSVLAMLSPIKSLKEISEAISTFELTHELEKSSIQAEKKVIEANSDIYEQKSRILSKMIELRDKGFLSETSVISATAELNEYKDKINQAVLRLEKLKKSIEKERLSIAQKIIRFNELNVVLADNDVFILDVLQPNHAFLDSGTQILLTAPNLNTHPTTIPVFFPNSSAGKVSKGLNALVTPIGIDSSSVGSIKAKVVEISLLSANKASINQIIGAKSLTELVQQNVKDPTPGIMQLSKISNNSYEWTSGQAPEGYVPLGSIASVNVTTSKVAPISLVIPFFRRTFGITPPEPKLKDNNALNATKELK